MNIFKIFYHKYLIKKPRNPKESFAKFLFESRNNHKTLLLKYNGKILIQIDSLREHLFWFEKAKINEAYYKNGYVLFAKAKTDIQDANPLSERFANAPEGKFIIIEKIRNSKKHTEIAQFIANDIKPFELSLEVKEFIETFYSFDEVNPKITFELFTLPSNIT
ncbi:hypothetical protein [uncultured Dokdonia sp.]|uniref:hypothetical protein n=1 Tax=uncultured Dokdonia sp. TaxID=575653 RepID=UPI00263824E3|nr:hypothetical protein [uncultured Dokdonia sp.]